jgi:hypothetical protein
MSAAGPSIRRALATAALGSMMGVALAGPPDLTGVWSVVNPPHALRTLDGSVPPLRPAARALYEQHLKAAAHGDRSFDGMNRCLPPGLPRLMLVKEPFEILEKPKVVYFVFQLNRLPRRAYIGESLPTDPDPHWLGYSVAHWVDQALVIESAGFNDLTVLDDAGLPHSEDLHLTERYELSRDGKHLHALFTIDDPKTFTRPWSARAEYIKRPRYEIPEEVCMDKLLRGHHTQTE